MLGQAAVLARHGYGTLLLDTRSHGRSGGHAMDFGWWGDRDIAAAVSFLGRQPGVQAGKIAVLGESMERRPWPQPAPTRGSALWSPEARPASSSPFLLPTLRGPHRRQQRPGSLRAWASLASHRPGPASSALLAAIPDARRARGIPLLHGPSADRL